LRVFLGVGVGGVGVEDEREREIERDSPGSRSATRSPSTYVGPREREEE